MHIYLYIYIYIHKNIYINVYIYINVTDYLTLGWNWRGCGRAPLALAPHTHDHLHGSCLLRRTSDPPRAVLISPYSGRDLCKVTPVILHWVVSPQIRRSEAFVSGVCVCVCETSGRKGGWDLFSVPWEAGCVCVWNGWAKGWVRPLSGPRGRSGRPGRSGSWFGVWGLGFRD